MKNSLYVLVCLLLALPAMAQIKQIEEVAKAGQEIERIAATSASQAEIVAAEVERAATARAAATRVLEARLIAAGADFSVAAVRPVDMPESVNQITASLVGKYRSLTNWSPDIPKDGIVEQWINIGGKLRYTSQSELARDLDKFYEGKGTEMTDPFGQTVKFYMLPVEGIIFEPLGYSEPHILKADRDFVVYNPARKGGQLAQNTPVVFQFYKPAVTATPADVVESVAQTAPRPTPQEVLEMNAQRFEWLRADRSYAQVWERAGGKMYYTNQDDLVADLMALHGTDGPKVRSTFLRKEGVVYELPVNGIVYEPDGRRAEVLDPSKYVVVRYMDGTGQLIERANLTQALFFTLVE